MGSLAKENGNGAGPSAKWVLQKAGLLLDCGETVDKLTPESEQAIGDFITGAKGTQHLIVFLEVTTTKTKTVQLVEVAQNGDDADAPAPEAPAAPLNGPGEPCGRQLGGWCLPEQA